MESIVSSVLTGFLALIGVIITTLESNKKIAKAGGEIASNTRKDIY